MTLYKPGDRVIDDKYGAGVITYKSDRTIRVMLDQGWKIYSSEKELIPECPESLIPLKRLERDKILKKKEIDACESNLRELQKKYAAILDKEEDVKNGLRDPNKRLRGK